MKKIFLLLITVLAILSCHKDNEPDTSGTGIVGTWSWIRTDGGLAYHIHDTPESTKNSYLLQFSADSSLTIIQNGVEVFNGDFEISKEKSIYSGIPEDYIRINDLYQIQYIVISGIISKENDMLSINDNMYDGVSSSYERIK